ncbi:MAG: tetratricopeptide repeat protein [Anaerolineae bacterium]
MNEAQTLFRDAVLAIRNGEDPENARKMLMQSLKLNPQNEMGWLWLARTLDEPRQKMDCIERALKLNPDNEQAQAMREETLQSLFQPRKTTTQTTAITPNTLATTPVPMQAAPPPVPAEPAPLATPPKKVTQTIAPVKSTQTSTVRKTQTGTFAAGAGGGGELAIPDKRRTTSTGRTIPAHQRRELSLTERRRIDILLDKANKLLEAENTEDAIEQWVKVLQIQHDHEEAMRNSVRFLSKLGYMEDAKELVWRAINGGTDHPSVYLTAIEIAERENEKQLADELRGDVVRLPQANEGVVITIADYYMRIKQNHRAIEILKQSLESHPDSQKILIRLGDLYHEQDREREAALYYDRAAALGTGTKEGKAADKKMKNYVPIMTDKERGSLMMAWREAFGFGAAALLLAFQDAGLNLLRLGVGRWAGVGLAVFGGYLLVTATSSPQQQGLAKLFGGHVPSSGYDGEEHGGVIQQETVLPIIPTPVRAVLGLVGGLMLVGAFALVFGTALGLLLHPVAPDVPSFCDVAPYFENDALNRLVGCF